MSETSIRRGSWSVIAPLGLIAAAYVWFVFLPTKHTIDDIREQIAMKRSAVTEAADTIKVLRKGKEDLDHAQKYLAACRGRLAAEEIGTLYGKIHEAAQTAKVRITRFDPQTPLAYEGFGRVPLTIGCTGSFSQLHDFLYRLESTPAALWLSTVKIERKSSGSGKMCSANLAW